MSYQKSIADALVTALSAVSGATTVQYRKADAVQPRDDLPLTILTAGSQRPAGRTLGGTIFKEYAFQVSIYRECLGALVDGIDTNAAYVLAAKQAVDRASLSGVSVVWDVDLVQDEAWERQEFVKGSEVSRFGLLVRTNEPQNG